MTAKKKTQIDVEISWLGHTGAELIQWVDEDDVINPSKKQIFKAKKSPLVFSYEGIASEDHLFEWILLFPDETVKELKARVCFDGGSWHTLSKHKKSVKNSWTDFGVAP